MPHPRTHRPPRRQSAAVNGRPICFDLMSAGRLANCMFQIAATVGLARRNNVDPVFPSSWVYRSAFSLPDEWYRGDLAGCVPADRLAIELPQRMRPYLQSLGLWSHCVDEVRAALTWSPGAAFVIDETYRQLAVRYGHPMGAIHVRRGDTITRNRPNTIQPLPTQYFGDAIDRMPPGPVVAFTDDPEWVIENMPGVDVFVGTPGPEDTDPDFLTRPRVDWIDMGVMQRIVEHGGWLAMSNSSYSWWSAWLADEPDRVFVPSRWFGSALLAAGFDVSLIMDPRWHVIETT